MAIWVEVWPCANWTQGTRLSSLDFQEELSKTRSTRRHSCSKGKSSSGLGGSSQGLAQIPQVVPAQLSKLNLGGPPFLFPLVFTLFDKIHLYKTLLHFLFLILMI